MGPGSTEEGFDEGLWRVARNDGGGVYELEEEEEEEGEEPVEVE